MQGNFASEFRLFSHALTSLRPQVEQFLDVAVKRLGGGSSGSILFLLETRSTNRVKTVLAPLPGD
jgi:hypothetical protein